MVFSASLSTLIRCWSACLLLTLWACKPAPSQEEGNEAQDPPPSVQTDPANPDSSMRSRGLGMADARLTNFVLADSFPQLARMVAGQTELAGELTTYARQVVDPGSLQSEEDLLALLTQRDEVLIPQLVTVLENDAEWLMRDEAEALIYELDRLGMFVQTAEGMFVGLGPAPFLEGAIARLGDDGLQWYLRFRNAEAEAGAGEYPFLDMAPYRDMIIAGEKLQEISPNTYFPRVAERFHTALEVFTDLHLVSTPTGRQEQEAMPMTGGVSTDFYPFAAEINTHRAFVEGSTKSRYQAAVEKILANPSRISERPEDIYVIVLDWVDQKEAAQQRIRTYLAEGEDIPHHLEVRQGDGKDRYCIAYRFFEDADQAQAALDQIRPTNPEAEMIMVSVKGDKLYQLGPG
ncbi:MAG: hypothetical protein D6722_27060 [Bacteroidetes bacterium]|nr:MAG: hypothetical protein D6722_27060 [Bacteroidota bacterium]